MRFACPTNHFPCVWIIRESWTVKGVFGWLYAAQLGSWAAMRDASMHLDAWTPTSACKRTRRARLPRNENELRLFAACLTRDASAYVRGDVACKIPDDQTSTVFMLYPYIHANKQQDCACVRSVPAEPGCCMRARLTCAAEPCTCNAVEAELKHNFVFVSTRVEKMRAQIFLI